MPTMSGNRWLTLVAVCLATFMLLLDITIVNVALPDIQRALHASFSSLEWVLNSYALSLAALMLVAGSLADLFGRKLVFTIGLVVFTAASLACALAQTDVQLILFRAIQGVGGAMMFATALALLAVAFTGRERATAIAIWGATTGAAAAVGPLVGGALVDGLGWESIFLLNIPIGIVTVILTLRSVGESRNPAAGRIDWPGLLTFAPALFLVTFALVRASDIGFGEAEVGFLLLAAALMLAAFMVVDMGRRDTLLDTSLFRIPAFVGAAIAAFTLSASLVSMLLYLVLYLQNFLGHSPFTTGVELLVIPGIAFFLAPIAAMLSERIPLRLLLGGGLIATGGGLLLMANIGTGSKWTHLLPGFILAGVGMGFAAPTLANAAVEVVETSRSGMAAGINNTFRQLGTATGIAGLGVIFHTVVQNRVGELLGPAASRGPGTGALADAITSGGVQAAAAASPPAVRGAVVQAGGAAFIDGMNQILLVAGIIGLVGGVLALVLVRSRDFVTSDIPRAERSSTFNSVPIPALPPLPEEITGRRGELLHPALR